MCFKNGDQLVAAVMTGIPVYNSSTSKMITFASPNQFGLPTTASVYPSSFGFCPITQVTQDGKVLLVSFNGFTVSPTNATTVTIHGITYTPTIQGSKLVAITASTA